MITPSLVAIGSSSQPFGKAWGRSRGQRAKPTCPFSLPSSSIRTDPYLTLLRCHVPAYDTDICVGGKSDGSLGRRG